MPRPTTGTPHPLCGPTARRPPLATQRLLALLPCEVYSRGAVRLGNQVLVVRVAHVARVVAGLLVLAVVLAAVRGLAVRRLAGGP
eukprot:2221909-Alexandrium_andersonii.AAC.1